jgi:hypothetical protein
VRQRVWGSGTAYSMCCGIFLEYIDSAYSSACAIGRSDGVGPARRKDFRRERCDRLRSAPRNGEDCCTDGPGQPSVVKYSFCERGYRRPTNHPGGRGPATVTIDRYGFALAKGRSIDTPPSETEYDNYRRRALVAPCRLLLSTTRPTMAELSATAIPPRNKSRPGPGSIPEGPRRSLKEQP